MSEVSVVSDGGDGRGAELGSGEASLVESGLVVILEVVEVGGVGFVGGVVIEVVSECAVPAFAGFGDAGVHRFLASSRALRVALVGSSWMMTERREMPLEISAR